MAETPLNPMPTSLITSSGSSREAQPRLETLRRMVLVTGNYINLADGASMTLHRIVDMLAELGVDVAVVAPTAGDAELPAAARMVNVPSFRGPVQGYRVPLGLGRRAVAAIERFEPQLVHVASPDPASIAAMRLARRNGLPITSTFHTNFPAYLSHWGPWTARLVPWAWRIMRWFYGQCDRVYVPTPSIGEELRAHDVLTDWAILARGVDDRSFGPQYRSEAWRRDHGLSSEDRVVLFCARIVWEKGLRTLVSALDHLRRRGPRHRVLIVGDGVQRQWLQEHLPHAIFTGFLNGEELARAYASADIFLYPSTTDTFGNVTLEALASGLPVVGARAPGTRSLVDEGENGLLVAPDDARGLAEASARLLGDDMLRRRMAHHALERAAEYRWTNILEDFAVSLDRLVGAAEAAPRVEGASALRRFGAPTALLP